ncbi:MAG TPA: AraC family transcriptional regulator [Pedobacter sp.]
MERFIQHEALFIRHFKTLQWPYPLHNHNHFELVFIHSGSGIHELNNERQPYHDRSIFLLAPADYHIFEIVEETEFSVIKFTNTYLGGPSSAPVKDEWNKLIDYLIAVSLVPGSRLVRSADDLDQIDQLIRLIVREWKSSLNAANEVVFYLIRAVFALIRKNAIHNQLPDHSVNGNLFIAIMDDIHLNIHDPEALSLESLAAKFNLSPNHLSSKFKQEIGVPVKKYISDYKFKLIENRLKFSNTLIKEISNDFGFTDLSHFNKFVKKYAGINPKQLKEVKS